MAGLSNLDEWRSFCDKLSGKPGWRSPLLDLGIQPPSAAEDATCRIPLIQADKSMKKAGNAKRPATALKHLHAALEWLDYPHPNAFPRTRLEMQEMRAEAKRLLGWHSE